MGSRRSRHNKGRKPVYKEHRENLCTDITILSCPTESLGHAPVRLNMLGERLNGFDPAELSGNFLLRRSIGTPTLVRPFAGDRDGAAPRIMNSEPDTPPLSQSNFSQSISTLTKSVSARKPESSGSLTGLTTQEPLNVTMDVGPNASINSLISCTTKGSASKQSQNITRVGQARSRPRSELLRQLSALDQNSEDSSQRENPEERGQYTEYWKRPASIISLSQRAAKKASKNFVRFGKDATVIDDLAQDIMVTFYEADEFSRPQNETTFEVWAYERARENMRGVRYGSTREMQDEIDMGDGSVGSMSDLCFDSLYHHQRPFQNIRMAFLDAIKAIGMLGEDDQRLVWRIIDGGDVVGYSKEYGVSLFEAMSDLAKCRLVMKRLSEDLADEKKFENPSPLPPSERGAHD